MNIINKTLCTLCISTLYPYIYSIYIPPFFFFFDKIHPHIHIISLSPYNFYSLNFLASSVKQCALNCFSIYLDFNNILAHCQQLYSIFFFNFIFLYINHIFINRFLCIFAVSHMLKFMLKY